jgi:excisionase family DNA binding protein
VKQREPLLTTKEFADYVRLHPSKITKRIRRGEIKAYDVCHGGRKIYAIPESELERFLAASKNAA